MITGWIRTRDQHEEEDKDNFGEQYRGFKKKITDEGNK